MKKTMTMALALVGIVGFVLADGNAFSIETAPAGYLEKEGSERGAWLCQVFNPFSGSGTLGDVQVAGGYKPAYDFVKVYTTAGKLDFNAVYLEPAGNKAGWYDKAKYDSDGTLVSKDDTVLTFGSAIQFVSSGTESKLVFAGVLQADSVRLALEKNAYNWIGNACPLAKKVGDVVPESFDVSVDYAMFVDPETGKLTRAIYVDSNIAKRVSGAKVGWHKSADVNANVFNTTIDDWVLPAGQGFAIYPYAEDMTIVIPGVNE